MKEKGERKKTKNNECKWEREQVQRRRCGTRSTRRRRRQWKKKEEKFREGEGVSKRTIMKKREGAILDAKEEKKRGSGE